MNRYLCVFALSSLAISLFDAKAGSMTEARVTQTSNDVQLIGPEAAPHPVSVNNKLAAKTIIRTGTDSRAEVTFPDQTVVRLAADTSFNFDNGGRDLNLEKGAVLVQLPKRARGTKMHAGAVTAAGAGTTAMLEYAPGVCKFLVLQGTGRLYRPKHLGDSVLVKPGQMIIGNPDNALSDPVDFDIDRFVKTSRFIVDLPPLRSEQAIASETRKQARDKSKKILIDTNLVIFGGGTMVSLVDPTKLDLGDVRTAESPTPTPSPSPETVELFSAAK